MEPALPRSSLLKIPTQRRSVQMVHDILDAAMLVLSEEGVAGFTTNRVADQAGISVGSLYQYFGNKEMILAGIAERGVLEAEVLIRQGMREDRVVEPHVALGNLLRALVRTLEPQRALLREILAATPLLSTTGILAVLETRIMDVARDFAVRNVDRYRFEGGPAAIYVAVNSAIFVFLKWLTDDSPYLGEDELIDALVHQTRAAVVDVQAA